MGVFPAPARDARYANHGSKAQRGPAAARIGWHLSSNERSLVFVDVKTGAAWHIAVVITNGDEAQPAFFDDSCWAGAERLHDTGALLKGVPTRNCPELASTVLNAIRAARPVSK